MSSPDGDFQPPFIMPHNDSPIYKKYMKLNCKVKIFWIWSCRRFIKNHFAVSADNSCNKGYNTKVCWWRLCFSWKEMNYNIAFFKHGYLSFLTTEPCPEFADIFKRFGKKYLNKHTPVSSISKGRRTGKGSAGRKLRLKSKGKSDGNA